MPKYRKKPVEIEAVQFTGFGPADDPEFASSPSWLKEATMKARSSEGAVFVSPSPMGPKLHIQTLEGLHTVSPSDWIIRGVKNELYPCKPDIFEATYDAVGEEHIAEDPDVAYLDADMEVPPEWFMDKSVLDFASSLRGVINRHNMESEGGDTPDFILANMLASILTSVGHAIHERDKWKNGVSGVDGPIVDVQYFPEHSVTLGDSDGDDGA